MNDATTVATKLEQTMAAHPEMDAIAITRIEVAKIPDPLLRTGLEAVIDLVDAALRGVVAERRRNLEDAILDKAHEAALAEDAAHASDARDPHDGPHPAGA